MDLIGKQYGALKVIKLCDERIKGCKQYLCLSVSLVKPRPSGRGYKGWENVELA